MRMSRVCERCSKNRISCDLRHPDCSSCVTAGVRCTGRKAPDGQEKPRSLCLYLEQQVSIIEQNLKVRLERSPAKIIPSITGATIRNFVAKETLVDNVISSVFYQPSFLPAAVLHSFMPSSNEKHRPLPSPTVVKDVPGNVIAYMLRIYAEMILPQYPCVSRDMMDICEANSLKLRSREKVDGYEQFVLYIILAISCMTLTWQSEKHAVSASESFLTAALQQLTPLDGMSEEKKLTMTLLLAHYSNMNPARMNNWICVTAAVELVSRLRLYMRAHTKEGRENKSRLFWATYNLEMSLCGTLLLPPAFDEKNVTCDYPDQVLALSGFHMFQYRSLELEVLQKLYLQPLHAVSSFHDVDVWIEAISKEIFSWFEKASGFEYQTHFEFKRIKMNSLLLRIYRPSPLVPRPSIIHHRKALLYASEVVQDYELILDSKRCFYPWHAVHILCDGALICMNMLCADAEYFSQNILLVKNIKDLLTRTRALLLRLNERWCDSGKCVEVLQQFYEPLFEVTDNFLKTGLWKFEESSKLKTALNDIIFRSRSRADLSSATSAMESGFDINALLESPLLENYGFDWDDKLVLDLDPDFLPRQEPTLVSR